MGEVSPPGPPAGVTAKLGGVPVPPGEALDLALPCAYDREAEIWMHDALPSIEFICEQNRLRAIAAHREDAGDSLRPGLTPRGEGPYSRRGFSCPALSGEAAEREAAASS